jgi:sulfur-oxidizing protein SoxZ
MANTIRARAELGASGMTTVKLIITHPMLIERTDPKTGQVLPAHFIEEVTIEHRGETVVAAAWGQAVSVNPFFQFDLAGAAKGDEITISWRDNRGQTDSAKTAVV